MRNLNLIDFGGIVRDWYSNAVERRELVALEDHMLRDIGITRAEAIEEARRPLWSRRRASSPPVATPRPAPAAPAPVRVDPKTIRRHIELAHVLRAKAMGDFARRAAHWLVGRSASQPSARIRKLAPVAR